MIELKKLALATLGALGIIFVQMALLGMLPLYGAIPSSLIASMLFWILILYLNGFRWLTYLDRRWYAVIFTFLALFLSRLPSSYNQIVFCGNEDDNFLKCLDKSSTLASVGDGITAIVIVCATIVIFLKMRGKATPKQ